MVYDFLAFYANGEAAFGNLIRCYREAANVAAHSRLGEIMSRHGSDKATWHSYPLLYEFLIGALPTSPKSIFEIGIGSNNLQVTGNMGADGTPGASHRAWREFLPEALIYGADYDVDCLFEEHGIHTFHLDQNDPASINRAWSTMPHLMFDLVLDDGAHTFEANTNMLDATYERIRAGGLYVVEDIVLSLSNINQFDQYFTARGWDAFMLRLPHSANLTDNAVAVVRPNPPPSASQSQAGAPDAEVSGSGLAANI